MLGDVDQEILLGEDLDADGQIGRLLQGGRCDLTGRDEDARVVILVVEKLSKVS